MVAKARNALAWAFILSVFLLGVFAFCYGESILDTLKVGGIMCAAALAVELVSRLRERRKRTWASRCSRES